MLVPSLETNGAYGLICFFSFEGQITNSFIRNKYFLRLNLVFVRARVSNVNQYVLNRREFFVRALLLDLKQKMYVLYCTMRTRTRQNKKCTHSTVLGTTTINAYVRVKKCHEVFVRAP